MRAAVEDVHHRHRQQVGVGAADVAVERQPRRLGRGLGDGERGAQDRVGAEVGLVGRAVELVHGLVDLALVVGTHALDRPGRSSGSPRRRPAARPCRGSGRRRRAARPPRTGPWTRRWARPRGRTRRRRAAPRPRRWGCRASRGSRGRRLLRWMPRVAPWARWIGLLEMDGRPHPIAAATGATGVQPVDRPGPRGPTMAAWRSRSRRTPRCSTPLRRLRPDRRAVLLGDRPRARRTVASRSRARRAARPRRRVAARRPSRSPRPSARPVASTRSTWRPAWCG